MNSNSNNNNNNGILPGVSICSVCMNRNSHLLQSLSSWVTVKGVDEIIIVDWGSKTPVEQTISSFLKKDKRIRLFTIKNVSRWILTVSFNLAIRMARYSTILKLDADNIIDPNFLTYHVLQHSEFYAGNWRYARNENERHMNGVVYMNRNDFISVFGYNEMITSYGYDDCDLYNRLSKIATRKLINFDKISHIQHTNDERVESQKDNVSLDVEIEKNRLISEGIEWKGPFSQFEFYKIDENISEAKYICGLTLDPSVLKRYLDLAIQTRTWIYKQKKLYIEVKNGLGNRLRALASAYNIAKGSGRKLVIIWTTDEHCEAKFSELFVWSSLFDGAQIIEGDAKTTSKDSFKLYAFKESSKSPTEFNNSNSSSVEYSSNFMQYNYMSTSDKDKQIDHHTEKDLYIISACTLNNQYVSWQRDCEFLRKMELQPYIRGMIEDYANQNGISQCIGIHVRMGQDSKKYKFEDTTDYSQQSKKSITQWRTK